MSYQVRPTMEELLDDICACYAMNSMYVRITDSRKEEVVRCRRIFCHVACTLFSFQVVDVADFLKCKSHASIIHHCKKVKSWMGKDQRFMDDWYNYTIRSKVWSSITTLKTKQL